MEAPLGSLRYSRPSNEQQGAAGQAETEAEPDAPEPEGPDQAALRAILTHYYTKLEDREAMRPDGDLPALYDSLRTLAARRE